MASFGVRLKQEREQRGITLDEISSTTKIGTRMLQALEEDHFDQLPGGIFNKGFIRAYARCLGLDEEQAIADYLVASGNVPPEKEKDKKSDGVSSASSFDLQAEADSREPSLPWGTFAILLLLAALGFAIWGFYSRQSGKESRKPPRTSSAAPSPDLRIPPAATSSSTPASTLSAEKIPSAPATKPASANPVGVTSSPAGQNTLPPAVPRPLTLRITLRSDSWLSVTSDGREVMQGSFTAPTEKSIRATREIVVKAGNVGALDFEFNGKTLPSQGPDGEVKTLTFDATGLRPPTPQP
ncbi:MAG TPA: RodZ domain-containing protein [Terriglobales bacterium]|nr:RodZ domain-containing protein [Terriglobales bacterium]